MENIFRDNYQKYRDLNFIVFPCPRNSKGPVIRGWNRNPPPMNYPLWRRRNASDNLWIRLDKVLVFDPDHERAQRFVLNLDLPESPMSVSGNKSIHRWFENPNGLKPLKLTMGEDAYLEVRTGSQGMVVPPSVHPETGKPYKWIVSPWDFKERHGVYFPELPLEIYNKMKALQEEPEPSPRMEMVQTEDSSLGSLDVAKYLAHYGIPFKIKQNGTRRIFALNRCLFADQHTTKDVKGDSSIIQGPDGKLGYHCFHNHCADKTWHDARQAISSNDPLGRFCEGHREISIDTSEEKKSQAGDIEFPIHILSGPAGDWANLIHSYQEVPKGFAYMCFLTCLGTQVCDKVAVASSLKPEPRLYLVMLSKSGGKKSWAGDQTIDLIFKRFLTRDSFSVNYGVGSAEGLADLLEQAQNLLVFWSELKVFVQKCKRENEALLPCVTDLFSRNKFHNRTRNHNVEIDNAHLSIIAGSTFDTYENMFSPAFLDIGLINRLFIVHGEEPRRFFLPDEIPQKEMLSIRDGLIEILRKANQIPDRKIQMDSEAKRMGEEWYMNIENSEHAIRLDEYALRLSTLLSINEGIPIITPEIMSKVLELVNYQLKVRKMVDPIGCDSVVGKMEIRIRRILELRKSVGEARLKDLLNLKRSGSLWVYDRAVANLTKHQEIRRVKKGKGVAFVLNSDS